MYAIKKPSHLYVAESTEDPVLEHFAWFASSFPTEEDSLEALLVAAKIDTETCHHCGEKTLERTYGSRTGTCSSCRRITFVTAGTFFDHMRKPRVWWCILVTLASKLPISIKCITDFLGVSYFGVWRNVHNVAMAIEQQMNELTLAITSGSFLPAVCRRSKETPRKAHPQTEEQEAQAELGSTTAAREGNATDDIPALHQTAGNSVLSSTPLPGAVVENAHVPDLESIVIQSLAASGTTAFEILSMRTAIDAPRLSATLSILEIDGAVVRLGGDHFRLSDGFLTIVETPVVNSCCSQHRDDALSLVQKIISHLKSVHRGISRKYLQRYACLYWCLTNDGWTLENLLSACLLLGEVEDHEITEYVSPLAIKVLACSVSVRP